MRAFVQLAQQQRTNQVCPAACLYIKPVQRYNRTVTESMPVKDFLSFSRDLDKKYVHFCSGVLFVRLLYTRRQSSHNRTVHDYCRRISNLAFWARPCHKPDRRSWSMDLHTLVLAFFFRSLESSLLEARILGLVFLSAPLELY